MCRHDQLVPRYVRVLIIRSLFVNRNVYAVNNSIFQRLVPLSRRKAIDLALWNKYHEFTCWKYLLLAMSQQLALMALHFPLRSEFFWGNVQHICNLINPDDKRSEITCFFCNKKEHVRKENDWQLSWQRFCCGSHYYTPLSHDEKSWFCHTSCLGDYVESHHTYPICPLPSSKQHGSHSMIVTDLAALFVNLYARRQTFYAWSSLVVKQHMQHMFQEYVLDHQINLDMFPPRNVKRYCMVLPYYRMLYYLDYFDGDEIAFLSGYSKCGVCDYPRYEWVMNEPCGRCDFENTDNLVLRSFRHVLKPLCC
jgi:hypothetical protein